MHAYSEAVLRLSAIVPATNDPPTLPACLDAIQASSAPPDELLVVRVADRSGPAAARNEGAARATGDVLVFVDADVVVHRDAFQRIRDAFDAEPDLAALFGSYDDAPAGDTAVSAFRNLLHHHVHHEGAGPATTFWGGLGAMRADVFREAGGFDAERFTAPSVEDIELGMRVTSGGGRIVLDPAVQGTHLKVWTLGQMVHTDLLQRGVPWARLLLEGAGHSGALNLSWRHRLSTLAAVGAALSLVIGRFRLALGCVAVLVLLNRSFYGLLLRRRGPVQTLAGVVLHGIHHLTAAAAVPLALLGHLRRSGGA